MKNITKELKFCYIDILQLALIPLGGWLIGETIIAVAIKVFNESTYFSVGSIIALSVLGVIMLILPTTQILTNFSLCVSMGRTRKQYLLGISLVLIVQTISLMVFTFLLSNLSYVIKEILYKNSTNNYSFNGIISIELIINNFWIVLIAPFVFTTIALTVSALIKKFSSKVLWVIWAVYMVCVLSITARLDNLVNMQFISNFIITISSLPPYVLIGIGIFIWLIILIVSIKYLLKASV